MLNIQGIMAAYSSKDTVMRASSVELKPAAAWFRGLSETISSHLNEYFVLTCKLRNKRQTGDNSHKIIKTNYLITSEDTDHVTWNQTEYQS